VRINSDGADPRLGEAVSLRNRAAAAARSAGEVDT